MEHFVLSLLHAAAWLFLFIFLFAIIGVIATIRFIVGLFTSAERGVMSGVERGERLIERR
ncbi:MAG: hypothetical protein JO043_01925 [Candidatus Eremiobacteraeota bacterium]|nr:hypothetical protein [Candidatus Eremiobacteraeota bacterium]